MESPFSKFIESARDIRQSGRWAAANRRLIELAANPGPDNAWWVQVFSALCEHTFSGYLALCTAYDQSRPDASLLAWRSRNLLELSVWAIYCSKSRENALTFYGDAGRDIINLVDVLKKWGEITKQDAGWLGSYGEAEQALSKRAAVDGVTGMDGSFKEVRKAAKDCGMGHHFTVSVKALSKYAHPTAMMMLGPPQEAMPEQSGMFFGLGCLYFAGAFDALERELLKPSI